jgi:hypothetical protein
MRATEGYESRPHQIEIGVAMTDEPTPGRDTATGTDPNARYDHPGYEDKSFGQAVSDDEELAERLLDETDGDVEAAEERFDAESSGSPAIKRQRGSG